MKPEPPDSSGAGARGGTYLLTWTTHGTWLPGDERGFVSRVPNEAGGNVIHNRPGEPYDFDEPRLRRTAASRQKGRTVILDQTQAGVCVEALREVSDNYDLAIYAGAVMATHVHLAVGSATAEGARLLHLFKGVSSRRLGQRFGPRPGGSWWTRHGSRRLLTSDPAILGAIRYVNEQPSAFVVFEHRPGASDRPDTTNRPDATDTP